MSWITYLCGAIICFTFLNVLQKIVAVDSKNPRAVGFVFNSIAALFTAGYFFVSGAYTRFALPSDPIAYIFMVVGVVFYGLFERFRFKAAQLLDVSVFITILTTGFVVSFIGSLFLYHEQLTISKLEGVICILISLLLVTYKRQHKKVQKQGIILAFILSFILGIAWMTDKKGAEFFNADTYSLFVWIFPLFFIFFPSIPRKDMQYAFRQAPRKIILLSFLNAAGYLLQLKAFELAEATIIMPLVQITTLLTVITGVIFLHERDDMKRKIIAAILACVGVYFLI